MTMEFLDAIFVCKHLIFVANYMHGQNSRNVDESCASTDSDRSSVSYTDSASQLLSMAANDNDDLQHDTTLVGI